MSAAAAEAPARPLTAAQRKLLDAARRMLAHGYPVVPIGEGSKAPYLARWQTYGAAAPRSLAGVEQWLREGVQVGDTERSYTPAAWGIVCDELVAVDVDVTDEELVERIEAAAVRHLGEPGGIRTGKPPKFLLLYRANGEVRYRRRPVPNPADSDKPFLIEIKAAGGHQIVAHGIHPTTGKPYSWAGGSPLTVPLADLPAVTQEQVDAFLDEVAPLPEPESRPRPPNGDARPVSGTRQTAWLDAMLAGLCEDIRTAPNGQQEATLNAAALRAGHFAHLIGADRCHAALLEAGLAMISHNPHKPWREKNISAKIARGLAQGDKDRQQPPIDDAPIAPAPRRPCGERRGEAGHVVGETAAPPEAENDVYCAAELQDAEFPPIKYIVANLITEGFVVIGGKPKLGKTTLLTGVALAVAEGGAALGKVAVEGGDVLMVALESNRRSMQRLLRLLLDGRPMPKRLDITHTLRRLDDGGLDKIRRWLTTHPDARAVIVDTWGKVRPAMPRHANPYDHDYHWASELKKLADQFGVAVIAITHLRKATAEDVFDEIGGSSGLTAAGDVNIVIKRERGQCDATLRCTGREIEEQELALSFAYPNWTLLGDADAYRMSQERVAICRALSRTPGMTAKQLADELGKKAPAVTNLLNKLLADGFVRDIGGGKWIVSASAPH